MQNVPARLIPNLPFDALDDLFDFVMDDRLAPIVRQYVGEATALLVVHRPELRFALLAQLSTAIGLETLFGKSRKPDYPYLSTLVRMALIGSFTELVPNLEKLFDTVDFFDPSLGENREIIKALRDKDTTLFEELTVGEPASMDEFTRWNYECEFGDDDDEFEDDEFEDDFDEEDDDLNYDEDGNTGDNEDDISMRAQPSWILDARVKRPREYELSITLNGIEPKIWRRVLVPSSLNLETLANLLLNVMGWENFGHLHDFIKGNVIYAPGLSESGIKLRQFDSCNCNVATLLPRKGSSATLRYDFGDGWQHTVTVEAVRAYAHGEKPRVAFVDGANACPPEDIGGVWGYKDLVEAMKKPRSRAARDYIDWLGERYDPTHFNSADVQQHIDWLNTTLLKP